MTSTSNPTQNTKITNNFAERELEDFAALLILFKKLRDTLVEDREQWAGVGGDMAHLIEALETQVKQFKTLQPNFKAALIECIRGESKQAAHAVSRSIEQRFQEILEHGIKSTVKHLDQMTLNIQRRMQSAEEKTMRAKWWALGITISSSLLGGVMGGAMVNRIVPARSFTHTEHGLMRSGQMIEDAWSGLSEVEKDKITTLARGEKYELPKPETKKLKKG